MKRLIITCLIFGFILTATSFAQTTQNKKHLLTWDAELKEYKAKYGEREANVTFQLTNNHSSEIIVKAVAASCRCTVAKIPKKPWPIAPGESGEIKVTVNLRGKSGTFTKSVYVYTSSGIIQLAVKVIMDPPGKRSKSMSDLVERKRNQLAADNDRQLVFKNDCAKCHAAPARGKMGKELYVVACGICHDSPNRATMVPDLKKARRLISRDQWEKWIKFGRKGSLMPAFLDSEGGPLTNEQVTSLVEFLEKRPLNSNK